MEDRPILKHLINDIKNNNALDDILQFTGDFERMMTYYWCAMKEVETKFQVLNKELSLGGKRNPIESIKTRLKSVSSIQGKLTRKNMQLSCQSIEDNLNDVAGIRVICSYIDDIYMITDCLLKQDDIKLIEIKDYIKNPKPNGYRSLHLIIEIPIFLSDEKRMVRVEIQIRTIAMESWANLEHGIRYKKEMDEETKEKIANKLNKCADLSRMLDLEMQKVRDLAHK